MHEYVFVCINYPSTTPIPPCLPKSYHITSLICPFSSYGPAGGNIPVTNSNREEYVHLYVQHILDTSIAPQFEAFRKGIGTILFLLLHCFLVHSHSHSLYFLFRIVILILTLSSTHTVFILFLSLTLTLILILILALLFIYVSISHIIISFHNLPYSTSFQLPLSHSTLSHSTLSHSTLSHSTLSHSTLSHSTLPRSTLSHSTLPRSTLSHSTLSHSTLSHSTLSHSTLCHSTLSHSTLFQRIPQSVWRGRVRHLRTSRTRTLNLWKSYLKLLRSCTRMHVRGTYLHDYQSIEN